MVFYVEACRVVVLGENDVAGALRQFNYIVHHSGRHWRQVRRTAKATWNGPPNSCGGFHELAYYIICVYDEPLLD